METRDNEDLDVIRRRRQCSACMKRFTTYERIENINLIVIKRDGKREQFSREKLYNGLLRACEKTTIPVEIIDRIVIDIIHELRGADSIEIKSSTIGELVATELKQIDKVAYIRFASVFKRFVDAEDFEREVKRLIQ